MAELVEKDKQKRKKKNRNRPDLMARYQQMLEEQAAQNGGQPGGQNGSRKQGGPVSAAKLSDDDDEGQGEVKLSKAKQKEYERMLIREARRRQAEKYGEEFIDDDDD